ncbi:thiamine-binding protein [Halorussus ruber]|uniref:thiamine-binding protein n=1 Tax=Halorussus ruber TaxID=1126238 RepID=UPI0010933324
MSVVARLEVIPTREESMSDAVADAVEALEGFDVSYETTPTDTVIEAENAGEVFAAAEAAHAAVADDRVITSLEVDDQRTRSQRRHDRVESVERRLGRPAKRERPAGASRGRETEGRDQETGTQSALYGGPRRSKAAPAETGPSHSRYLRAERPLPR